MLPDPRTILRRKSILLPLLAISVGMIAVLAGLQSCGQLVGANADVKVTRFSPQGECDLTTNIIVEFSNDLVPDDSLDRPVLDPPLEFDPPIMVLKASDSQFLSRGKFLPMSRTFGDWMSGASSRSGAQFHSIRKKH